MPDKATSFPAPTASLEAKVNPTPILTANIATSSTICSGQSLVVTANYTGNLSTLDYCWIVEQCSQSGVVDPSFTAQWYWNLNATMTSGTPFTFQIPGSESLPCNKYYRIKFAMRNLSNCLPWVEAPVSYVYLACKPNGLTTVNNICLGSSTTLCIDEVYEQPSNTYTVSWSKKGNNINCINVTPTTNGQTIYTATITNTITGCVGQKRFIVNAYSAPNPNFSYAVNTSNSLYNTITATPNNLSGTSTLGYEEKWKIEKLDVSGNVISNTELGINPNPSCWQTQVAGSTNFSGYNNINNVTCSINPGQFAKNTTYRITRYVRNAYCSQWQSYSPNIISPLRKKNNEIGETSNQISDNLNLTSFPNPSNGLLSLNLKNALDAKYNIEVFDVYGKLIYKDEVFNITGSEFNTDINLSNLNLSNGLYLINVDSDKQKSSQRIIIEK